MAASHGAVATDGETRFYMTKEHHPENGTLLGFWIY
ncbi:MAG: cytochrome o ubiquinol oxidase subunit III, partial [bacterium]|nr:cytochrome o ubiquinol oxidase subunit III [bacterium]